MSNFTSRPLLRWAVPAAAAIAVIAAGVAAKTLAAAAEPSLPPRSAAQLLVDLQTAQLDGLSGTVVERADLGLPALPNLIGGAGSSDLTSLINGKHTLRVWYSGPDKARVSLLGTNGQSDLIHNGTDLWTWDSKTNAATHRTLATHDDAGKAPGDLPSSLPKSPQEAADLALKALDPTTVVTTGKSAQVAGRSAYELVLSPRDTNSLVAQVRLAIDAQQHLPLRVQILAKGSDQPAFEVAFSQVSFDRPDAARFAFNPPAGAKVTEEGSGTDKPGAKVEGKPGGKVDTMPDANALASGGKSTVIGTGWTSVLVLRTGTPGSDPAAKVDPQAKAKADQLLNGLPKLGSNTVVTSKLFTAMLTADGRLLVGAVSKERLAQVAADPAAALK